MPNVSEGLTSNEPTPDFNLSQSTEGQGDVDPADISELSDLDVKLAILDDSNVVSNTHSRGLEDPNAPNRRGMTAAEVKEANAWGEAFAASPEGQALAAEAEWEEAKIAAREYAADAYVTERALGFLTMQGREVMAMFTDPENFDQSEIEMEQALAYDYLSATHEGQALMAEAQEDGLISEDEMRTYAQNAAHLQNASIRTANAQEAQAAQDDRVAAAERIASRIGVEKTMASVSALKASGVDLGSMTGDQLEGAIRAQDSLLSQSVKAQRDADFKAQMMGTTTSKHEGLEIGGKPVQAPYVAKAKPINMESVISLIDSAPSRSASIRSAVGNTSVVDDGMAEARRLAGKLHEASRRRTAQGR